MKRKTFFVTNSGEGSITITGRHSVHIPGLCVDSPVSLPENTAAQTIARLKQRYPLLKFREAPAKTDAQKDATGATAGNGIDSGSNPSANSPQAETPAPYGAESLSNAGSSLSIQSDQSAIPVSSSKKKSK